MNEIIVDRLLSILGIEHLEYRLLHADVLVDDGVIDTYLCESKDFKAKDESKIELDAFYQVERLEREKPLEFCIRMGWERYIYEMLVVDFLILNRDRHGANIEVLRNSKNKTLRLAPLFDHGLALLFQCRESGSLEKVDVMEDKPVQCFVGSKSAKENLTLIPKGKEPKIRALKESDREVLFAIRDESEKDKPILGYLVYYEKDKNFYIKLPENADPWRTPLLLSSFVKKGEQTVNAYWSKLWVQQRIVPSDRQNIGKILKENGLDEYDEYGLLMLGEGRCAQDDYYLEALLESELPQEVAERFQNKVEDVVPLKNRQLLVFFRDEMVRKCDMRPFFEKESKFLPLLNSQENFCKVAVAPGGYGICWGETITISDKELYEYGTEVGLSLDDFRDFVSHRVVNAAEAAEILECSRQNIGDLVQREKLHPIKREAKNTLFLKSEVVQRKWL